MTILAPPRAPIIENALAVAKQWCAGRTIDDRPALTHAARVAVTVGEHRPDVDVDVVAAALLHDAPEFAPVSLKLDHFLEYRFGPEGARLNGRLEPRLPPRLRGCVGRNGYLTRV